MAFRDLGDLFGGACRHHTAPAIAAFGPDVDDVVGGFHHVEVVFDHHDRIALIDQFMQHFQQLAHIFEMQAGGGFIQNIQRPPRGPFAQFLGQLDPLRLAAGQGRRLLAHLDVAKPTRISASIFSRIDGTA